MWRLVTVIVCIASSVAAKRAAKEAGSKDAGFKASAMYRTMFDEGATFYYSITAVTEEDDIYYPMQCKVSDVRTYRDALASRFICDGRDSRIEEPSETAPELGIPRELSPDGIYVATRKGLFRASRFPSKREVRKLSPDRLVMLPTPRTLTVRAGKSGRVVIEESVNSTWWCMRDIGNEPIGDSFSMCFKPGVGPVGGGYWGYHGRRIGKEWDGLHRFHYELADVEPSRVAKSRVPTRVLVINEISAAGVDWFEVVNASRGNVDLDDFVYTDAPDNFVKAIAFPKQTLTPGARYVQEVTDEESGFKLAGEESLSIYRSSNHALSDTVKWKKGESPAGSSYSRIPDVAGAFKTTAQTRGRANQPGAKKKPWRGDGGMP